MTSKELSELSVHIAAQLAPLSAEERSKVRTLVTVLLDEAGEPHHVDTTKPPGPRPPFGRPSGGLSR